jgi:hypothetical protein
MGTARAKYRPTMGMGDKHTDAEAGCLTEGHKRKNKAV